MIRRSSLSLVALTALVVLAVGSDGIDIPEPDRAERLQAEARTAAEAEAVKADFQAKADARRNVEACREWIAAFNALECMPEAARISAETACPESLDLACEQEAYWACMVEKTQCVDGRPTRPDPSECPPPC
jgi:hypothetical protein